MPATALHDEQLYLGVSVEEWKLRFYSVKTSDGKHLNGNEFLRTAKKGDRFIVSGDIKRSESSIYFS